LPTSTALTKDISGNAAPHFGLSTHDSQFQGLTLREREELGGVEYRALTVLAFLVPKRLEKEKGNPAS